MYSRDQALTQRHAETEQGFLDTVVFVLATVNQHFYNVGTITDTYHTAGLDETPHYNAVQKRGIAYAMMRAPFYTALLADVRAGKADLAEALKALVEIPGIGMVKAGFILQLTCGMAGCLDRHNLRTAGLNERIFQRVPAAAEALTARIRLYLKACEDMGTPEEIWDGWSRLIAAKYPNQFCCADDVSWKHALWTRSAEGPEKNCDCV